MLLPIAKNLYDRHKKLEKKDVLKILYWYWSALFGGRYREKQNSRSIEDILNLNKLLKTGQIEKSIEETSKKVFSNEGYSDYVSLKNKETPALEAPILQFILTNSILDENLNNCSEVIEKLKKPNFEKSHLISLNDFNKDKRKENKIERASKHYINSIFNLALLPEPDNREDRAQSWCFWPHETLKKYNVLIPKIVNGLNWNQFTIQARDATSEKWNLLSEKFIEARAKKIKETVIKRLNQFKDKWKE